MSRFLADKYASLDAYTPGEQPQDKKYIKLNTNESPYPPSPETVKAVSEAEVSSLNLYSDPVCKELKEAIAKRYNLKEKNIFVSNGSDDILNFAFMAFGKKVTFPDITYGFYKVFSALHGCEERVVPLREDFSLCADDYLKNDSMVVIANPNAPTGMILPLKDIEKIVSNNPDYVVLVDEAYIDFGGESALSLVRKYDNLLVVRTFSKSYSLAGARLGYAMGNENLISDLEKIKYSTNPYSINRLSNMAGIAAIESCDYYMKNCSLVIKAREYTVSELCKLGFCVLPSSANFVFAKKDGLNGEKFYLALKDKGVLVRHFTSPRIKDFNRITIGTMEQMEKFIEITKDILRSENI